MPRRGPSQSPPKQPVFPPPMGRSWSPVSDGSVADIAATAVSILTDIGLSDAPASVTDAIVPHGGTIRDGRLLFPETLLQQTLADGPKTVHLCGQDPAHDMTLGGCATYLGTGGAAPFLLSNDGQSYRPSGIADLHAAARLADHLPHVDFFSRSLVAGDIEDPCRFDLATAAASLLGTAKHVMVQATHPDHVQALAHLCYRIAGSEPAFRARPFLSLNINHIVPPLRFHAESADVMAAAVAVGIPVHCNVFGQLGASSPVTIAGSVAQTLAEVLAGLAFVHALNPAAPRIAGPRPMITDLRTGGMAGGAGEQAAATGLAVQVLRHWDLPCSVIAGATDSKLADFQSGYEKALTLNTAVQAGAHLITQAAGAQAGLMAVSFAAMVADNDMIGAIRRANTPIEVSTDTLSTDAISAAIATDGHFLGQPETYARMRSDFLYPEIADRQSLEDWFRADNKDMAARAAARADRILATHWPAHVPQGLRHELEHSYGLPRKEIA